MLKLVSLLGILYFYFNYVQSFSELSDLLSRYSDEIMSGTYIPDHSICFTSIIQWATVCQNVFQRLRSDNSKENPYLESLYVNYHAFNMQLPQCEEKKISFEHHSVMNAYSHVETVLNCYAGLALAPAYTPIHNYQHFKEISILPEGQHSIMVFKCHQKTNYCILLEWYDKIEWAKLTLVPQELFFTAVPKFMRHETLLYMLHLMKDSLLDMSMNQSNVVNSADPGLFSKMCYALYNRPKYRSKIEIDENETIISNYRRNSEEFVMLQFEELTTHPAKTFIVNMHSCNGFYHEGTNLIYKLMAGPEVHSVILVKQLSTEDGTHHKALELIVDVNILYLNEIDKY